MWLRHVLRHRRVRQLLLATGACLALALLIKLGSPTSAHDFAAEGPFLEHEASLRPEMARRLAQGEPLRERSPDGVFDMQDQGSGNEVPSTEYEQRRRGLRKGIHELWHYMSSEMRKLNEVSIKNRLELLTKINSVLEIGAEHLVTILSDLRSMYELDVHNDWREKEAAELSEIVQKRLLFLQNPPDCSRARKLVCSLDDISECNVGCSLHHVVYCFIMAYASERTLILKSEEWEEMFMPLSEECRDGKGDTQGKWTENSQMQVVYLPIRDNLFSNPPYLPQSVPADLVPRLVRLHGNPFVWWVGQLFKYLLRPQKRIVTHFQTVAQKTGFEKHIVGVYIQRKETKTDTTFYPIEQYMEAVDQYFDVLDCSQEIIQRRIYLASDDPTVFDLMISKYPQYEILNYRASTNKNSLNSREEQHMEIIADIHFLSLSDYIVCTFSSHLCRVAYEIMQSLHPDAADRFCSLDDIYYYEGQLSHSQVAIYPHYALRPNELDLRVGDEIKIAENQRDGFCRGENLRSEKEGLYPCYKVMDKVEAVDFPTYSNVTLKTPLKKSRNFKLN